MDDDDDDDEFMVVLDAHGRIANSVGACEVAPAIWDNLISFRKIDLEGWRTECQRAAWPLAAQSFWLPMDATPHGPLETLAMSILKFHTEGAVSTMAIDPASSGAEWWANVTRSEMLHSHGDIHMHFDKDERAFANYGLVVHPLLSTVTYLSDAGAATVLAQNVVLDAAASGQYVHEAGAAPSTLLVPPRVGRHLSFDGRWLHGAPASLLAQPAGAVPYERITFCVNVWIGHQPGRCQRFQGDGIPPNDIDVAKHGALDTQPDHLMAPRMRLSSARSVAARREARTIRVARIRCDANGAMDDGHATHRLRLEQTDAAHELLLPMPGWLGAVPASWAKVRQRGWQGVVLHGDGIVLRRTTQSHDATAPLAADEECRGTTTSKDDHDGCTSSSTDVRKRKRL